MMMLNTKGPLMGHPAMLTPFPIECTGVVADAGAPGGSGHAKPWMLAAGALVVGVTAAAAMRRRLTRPPRRRSSTAQTPGQTPRPSRSATPPCRRPCAANAARSKACSP
jgi:hypothetical protein